MKTATKIATKPKKQSAIPADALLRFAAIKQKSAQRSRRIDRIAKKLTQRNEIRNETAKKPKRPFARKETAKTPRIPKIIAYDLETTRIKRGTPKPIYITAYGDTFSCSAPVSTIENLGSYLIDNFLIPENIKARFVAWNGNRFDAYFVAAALLHHPEYTLRPYLTRSKSVRGLKVILGNPDDKSAPSWEFLDGMSMTGSTKPLKEFLKTFAPDYLKLDAPNWETENFNPKNKKHVAYAERDSEGLYHALIAAQRIIQDNFNIGLKPTIGNLGIKIFQSHIPATTICYPPPFSVANTIRDYGMRGGFCYCAEKFEGKVWKYDLNQAYAAAMRETALPGGRCFKMSMYNPHANNAIYRVKATASISPSKQNRIPFYYRSLSTGKSMFSATQIDETWITSSEYIQLKNEGWKIEWLEGWAWETSFKMKAYVDKLESLRVPAPKSAQGEMIKSVGNNSYGKTVERVEDIEFVMSAEQPEGFHYYQPEDDAFQHLFFRFKEQGKRDYHQPQIGMFITAYVRMQVRRAALSNAKDWIYADTDCVVFKSPAHKLKLSATEYGKWKQETDDAGEDYRFIAKKVYANFNATEKHAKGMNVKHLTENDFKKWYDGDVPSQNQVHRNNFVKVMTGADMFIDRTRKGTNANTVRAV